MTITVGSRVRVRTTMLASYAGREGVVTHGNPALGFNVQIEGFDLLHFYRHELDEITEAAPKNAGGPMSYHVGDRVRLRRDPSLEGTVESVIPPDTYCPYNLIRVNLNYSRAWFRDGEIELVSLAPALPRKRLVILN